MELLGLRFGRRTLGVSGWEGRLVGVFFRYYGGEDSALLFE